MDYNKLLKEVEATVRSFFLDHYDLRYVYHDIKHTEEVVRAACEIANHFQVNDQDFFIVISAAWFHDTGYFVHPECHEQESTSLANSFFKNKQVPTPVVQSVADCILATQLPQCPKTLLEQIVCDADLYHLGTKDFPLKDALMRQEIETIKGIKITDEQWEKGSLKLFSNHQYHTDYCRLLLNDRKRKNRKKIDERMKDTKTTTNPSEEVSSASESSEKTGKNKQPKKGIETMFRVASSNSQRLSRLADNKAHIMITVNSIILSAIIGMLLRRLDAEPFLITPTFLILTVCVLTIIFSILATRPSIPKGTFSKEDMTQKRVNLLFFGNFYKMSLDEYAEGMWQMMEDHDFLYGSLIKDVYFQGVVLGRKYKFLRISYNIFMFGLILSVLAFIIATVIGSA